MKLKVLHIGTQSLNIGGVGSYIKSIIKGSHELFDYFTCTSDDSYITGSAKLDYKIEYNLLTLPSRVIQLIKIIKINKIDLIHAHTQRTGLVVALAKLIKKNIKIIYTPHGLRHTQLTGLKKRWHYYIELFILSQVNLMTAITKKESNEIPRYKNKTKFIKSVIEQVNVSDKTFSQSLLEKLSKYDHLVLMIGSVDERKQPHLFVDIAENSKLLNVLFMWIGDGPLLPEINKRLDDLYLNNISFIGKLNRAEVYHILKYTDALLMTSSSEGFPLVILEAYSFGVPVIANSFYGVEEIVQESITGNIIDMRYLNRVVDILVGQLKINEKQRTDQSIVIKNFARPYQDTNRFCNEYIQEYEKFKC